MRLSRYGLIAISFGAVILAATLVSPALGGPSLKKLVKKEVKKEVSKQIAKATGPAGPPGPPGANGTNGASGIDGTARAYARVDPPSATPCTGGPGSDECAFDRSKGVTRVTRDDTGSFCVTVPGISSASVPAAVTVDYAETSGPEGNASAMIEAIAGPCEPGFQVITQRQPDTTVRNEAGDGTTQVAGNAVPADNVGFTIVIP